MIGEKLLILFSLFSPILTAKVDQEDVDILAQGKIVNNFGCQANCWEKCLNQPGRYVEEYKNLTSIIYGLRGLRQSWEAYGTGFLMDSTVNDGLMWYYQKFLAAILAITLPVQSDDYQCGERERCNPFFTVQYFEEWSG